MENTEHIKFVRPKVKSEDEIRTEGRNEDSIVNMFLYGEGFKNYDLSDGSLLYEPASDGVSSAEALLIDIETNTDDGHVCVIYKGRRD